VRAAPEQLQHRLIPDLDPAAGHERDAAAQIGELRPLVKVQRRALGTQLIVEVMQRRIGALADVARARLDLGARGD
jgi:hypothetical protein